ncbi:hypothetical protein [Tenacibaculum jejuense]|uniref:Uncharacterized protein n=1 Tax=Tenacibaculum jejuense TaxID=584609 RepID=A0A238UEL9_9FLAO|nr:hypothetical protein [Tenacibaculum jejuense]SNR17028.1 protein of unknown function [Tenacibaculum jejuense]
MKQDKEPREYRVKEVVLSNDKGWTNKYTILDHITETPYKFKCIVCNDATVEINHYDLGNVGNKTCTYQSNTDTPVIIATNDIRNHNGIGFCSKVTCCNNCNTYYYASFGYTEPNNGRDVIFLDTILRLEEKKTNSTHSSN